MGKSGKMLKLLNTKYINGVIWGILFSVLFASIAWICVAKCHYYIFGDSVVYFNGLSNLLYNYFDVNNAFWLGEVSNHLQLTTEGGFTFLLYLASLLSWELPFFISAFFCVLLVFMLALLVNYLSSSKKTGKLSGVLIIALIFLIPGVAYQTFDLTLCLRDSAAHFFGFLGLFFCCKGIQQGIIKKDLIFGSFLIGIACWCRFPNVLFIVPAGIYVFTFINKLKFKQIFHSYIFMFIGLILGLLPLLSQNIYEGKPFYAVGQFASLVSSSTEQDAKEEQDKDDGNAELKEAPKVLHPIELQPAFKNLIYNKYNTEPVVIKGVSLHNFTFIYRSVFKKIRELLGMCCLCFFGVSIIVGLFFNYRVVLTFSSGALVFYIFYSLYDKSVARYTLIIIYFLLPIIAFSTTELFSFLLKRFKLDKFSNPIYWLVAAFIVAMVVISIKPYKANLNVLHYERNYIKKLRANTIDVLKPGDRYICFNPILQSSVYYLTGAIPIYWQLSVVPMYLKNAEEYFATYERRLATMDIFYLEMYSDINPYKYWSKQDVNLHYELNLEKDIFPMFSRTDGLRIHKITTRDTRRRVVEYSKDIEIRGRLMVWAEDVSEASPESQMAIFSTDSSSITNTLVKGINVYDLPDGFLDEDSTLYLSSLSTSPLPVIVTSEVFSTNIVIDLNSYENMPGIASTLSSTPFWHKNDRWKRDERHRKDGYIEPLTALNIYTDIPIYSTTPLQQVTVRFNTVAEMEHQCIIDELKQVRLLANENIVPNKVNVVKYQKRGDRRFVTADLISENNIGMSGNFTIGIDLKAAEKTAVFANSLSLTF